MHPDLHAGLHAVGLQFLDDAVAREEVPFVLEDVFEDEDGNELPDESPPRRVAVNVHQACFPITG